MNTHNLIMFSWRNKNKYLPEPRAMINKKKTARTCLNSNKNLSEINQIQV